MRLAIALLLAAQPLFAVEPTRAQLAERVRDEARASWRAYKQYAWGHDELRPLTRTPRDWYADSLLMTPVDSLDTLILLGLKDEANEAHQLIVDKLSFDKDLSVKNFEITIRLLGGLLSGYQLTGDERLLKLADDLGTRLLPVFNSPTGMPYVNVNLKTGKTSGTKSNPAEIGTLLLEFGTLSKLTHKPVYYDKAKNALVQVYNRRSAIGLVGEEIDVETGEWTSTKSHVGGAIDSYYEYLLKCARLFGDRDCEAMWKTSIRAVNRYLADDGWYGEADMRTGKRTATEFGSLHAFFPAVLAMSGDLKRARRLEDSAFAMWRVAGIEPEVIDYRTMSIVDARYPLRPEIIESAYYLRHYTHDARYVAMGRTFLDDLAAHCRTDASYTTLKSVVTKEKGDLMPSYFLAETLKYLYLIFAPDDALRFDDVVFNTEAHPLRRTWAPVAADGKLADALRIIKSKELVDLTHSFSPTTPVWPGFGQATMSAACDPKTHRPYTIEQDGFRTTFYSMVGQYGTHVDPPAHFRSDGMTMDAIPLQDMILPLVVFDVTPMLASDPNHALTVDDIKAWEKLHGTVPAGAFAALRTDMSKDWDANPERFKRSPFPAWSLAAIKFLFDERQVTAIGHESLDTDTTESMESETWILKQNHFQIEAMTNLDKVPPAGAVIVVTWPKIDHGFGFPARAIAILP